MNQFSDWPDMGTNSGDVLSKHDFDQYFEGYDNDIDDLFNETLLGIQDLDVPTGFVNDLQVQNESQQKQMQDQINHTATNSFNFHQAKHSRKISGAAIFGFDHHTRELSLDLLRSGEDKAISPVQLVRMNKNNLSQLLPLRNPISQQKEQPAKKDNDYLVTNANPLSYKFPPSPSPTHNRSPSNKPVNSYSAKYLQELSRLNQSKEVPSYVDDIGPSLENNLKLESQQPPQMKYVSIPVQEPLPTKVSNKFNNNGNTFLPPPSPPTLSHGSPEQHSPGHSSPEPQPYTRESSPSHINSSPMHNGNNMGMNNYFYNPQFFSDDNFFGEASSPINSSSVSSSPVKNTYFSLPLRHVPLQADETVDVNETIQQLTPFKQPPNTPSRNKVILEWSPIVSPSAKNNKDVRQAIKETPKRRIKKTSLLPPGELDRYWEGPDENKIFTCTYKNCGKKFTRRYNVRSHIQTHLSDRPFACIYCPKKFVRQHDLNRHVKGHLESRHCRCPCGKEFTRIDAMKKHRLRNICSSGVPPEEADSLRSPEKYSPPTSSSPLKQQVEFEEIQITNSLLTHDM